MNLHAVPPPRSSPFIGAAGVKSDVPDELLPVAHPGLPRRRRFSLSGLSDVPPNPYPGGVVLAGSGSSAPFGVWFYPAGNVWAVNTGFGIAPIYRAQDFASALAGPLASYERFAGGPGSALQVRTFNGGLQQIGYAQDAAGWYVPNSARGFSNKGPAGLQNFPGSTQQFLIAGPISTASAVLAPVIGQAAPQPVPAPAVAAAAPGSSQTVITANQWAAVQAEAAQMGVAIPPSITDPITAQAYLQALQAQAAQMGTSVAAAGAAPGANIGAQIAQQLQQLVAAGAPPPSYGAVTVPTVVGPVTVGTGTNQLLLYGGLGLAGLMVLALVMRKGR